MAHAHICAERALASEGMVAEKASGQVHICVCVCVERERESFLHQIQLSSMGKIWKSKVTVGGGGGF